MHKKAGTHGLVDIGVCTLHKVHNAFGVALDSTEWEIDAFVLDIYQGFKLSAARREDYVKIQQLQDVPEHTFLRYVQCRWLSLVPALERVLEQWASLSEYFTVYLPSKQPLACKNDRYGRIVKVIKAETSKAKILFLIHSAADFQGFLTLFQTEGPLIHLLYDKLHELYKVILGKYLKEEAFVSRFGRGILDESVTKCENELPDDKLNVGIRTRETLRKASSAAQKMFCVDVRKFDRQLSKKLRDTLPLQSTLLRDLQCLHPLARTDLKSADAILRVARSVPHSIAEENIDKVIAQFTLYQHESQIAENWFIFEKGNDANGDPFTKWKRVDQYWSKVLNITDELGQPKYHILARLVKCVLVFAHGNADVERGFAANALTVTEARSSLNETSISALGTVQDAVRVLGGGAVSGITVTREMLRCVRTAYSRYEADKEAETKRQKEVLSSAKSAAACVAETQKKETLNNLKKREAELKVELSSVQELLKEGNIRLADALKKKDATLISVAQAMLSSASSKLVDVNGEMTAVLKELHDSHAEQKSDEPPVKKNKCMSKDGWICELVALYELRSDMNGLEG
mgnify:FL=1